MMPTTPTVQKDVQVKTEVVPSKEVGYGVRPMTLAVTLGGLAGLGALVWYARSRQEQPKIRVKEVQSFEEMPNEYVGYVPMER